MTNGGEHVRRFLDGPEYPLVQYQLADLRDASVKPYLTEAEIGRVVKYMQNQLGTLGGKKIAIVAGNDWETPKRAEALLKSLSVTPIVFNSLSTACVWLGQEVVEVENAIKEIRMSHRYES